MLHDTMISGAAIIGLLVLGACSGKSDQANTTAAAAKTSTPAATGARLPKAGLWEMTLTAEGLPTQMKVRTCLGNPSPGSNPFAPKAPPGQSCSKNAIVPTATGYTIDVECSASGLTSSMHGVVTGDGSSHYRTDLTTTMSSKDIPAAAQRDIKSSVDATYVGACPADMKPGESR